jgi:3-oxoacyl-[acyl-carrier-protein] synthase II
MELALARGAKIYAEVAGAGMSADAYHITAPHPEGLGALNAMRSAIKDAGMTVNDIDHVNTHGTSTPLGDIAETTALVKLFGEHSSKVYVNSTKSMTGHLLGAAGAVEAMASIFALKYDIIPPTINHFTDDPEIDQSLHYVFNKALHTTVNTALSNTFGFGGHNATLIFKKFVQ